MQTYCGNCGNKKATAQIVDKFGAVPVCDTCEDKLHYEPILHYMRQLKLVARDSAKGSKLNITFSPQNRKQQYEVGGREC